MGTKYSKILPNPIAYNKKFSSKYRAQSMVEFALAIPIVLVLMVGIIEGWRLLFFYSSVATASREGARYGAGVGDNGGGIDRYKDCTGIRQTAKDIGFFAGVQDADISIHYDSGPGTATKYSDCSNAVKVTLGDRIIVGVTVPYSPVVPLLPIPSFEISSSNTHTIIKEVAVVLGTPQAQAPLPTATHTATAEPPTPTFTLEPGATETFTPTPGHTPTATETATATATLHPTPGGPCNPAEYWMDLLNPQGPSVTARVHNVTSAPIEITSITITWGAGGGRDLTRVAYGPIIWQGTNSSGDFTVSGGPWVIQPNPSFGDFIFVFSKSLNKNAT